MKPRAAADTPTSMTTESVLARYVIECPNCGVVYRSRQYWFGNQDPVDTVVRTEIVHVWPGTDGFLKDNNNAAQRLLDGMNFMAQSVSELSLGPTKAVTSWLTDQIAPAYWRPNSQILSCNKCATSFKDNDTKHHCRACGEGFCDSSSSKTRPVPERGWGPAPVRVCDNCYEARNIQLDHKENIYLFGPRKRKELWFHLKSRDISDCRDWKEPVVLKPYHRGGFDLRWPDMKYEAEFVTELLGRLSCREVRGRSFLVPVSV
uniref:zinc finger FYVE domain-containing protein 1 isoform X3 n=1 Tax=Callithrix jacchus TaxID=9483 RepID=UPI0023DD1AD8|nr:zinc finger FYVE domain-containing protein 1 isoform X3 [Callithrix jacchus]